MAAVHTTAVVEKSKSDLEFLAGVIVSRGARCHSKRMKLAGAHWTPEETVPGCLQISELMFAPASDVCSANGSQKMQGGQ